MAYTLEQLADLETAIAQGVRVVKYSDKEITYNSLSEMKELRNDMKAELGLTRPVQRKYPTFSNGTTSNGYRH